MNNEDSSKIDEWEKKVADYYANVTREQFRKDLEKAGFKVIDKRSNKKTHEKRQ